MATITSRIALRKRHSDQCLNEHVYTSGIVEHDDFFKPLFSGAFCEPSPTATVQGPYGATTTTGSGWAVGVIQVDIQVDANNDSTTAQRPPAAIVTEGPSTERIAEEVKEQGGTENPTGLIVPVNTGRDEGEDNEDEDHATEGVVSTDSSVVRGRLVLKLPPEVVEGSHIKLTYQESKLLIYRLSGSTATLIRSGIPEKVSVFGQDTVLLFEGIDPSASVGGQSILATLLPKKGRQSRDRVVATVVQVDLDCDTNNDGSINSSNNDEDRLEEFLPGKCLTTDDPLVVGTDVSKMDVAQVLLSIKPSDLDTGTLTLFDPVSGPTYIQVWDTESKANEVALPKTWAMSTDTPPNDIWVSAKERARQTLRIKWTPSGTVESSDAEFSEDEIRFNLLRSICRTPKVGVIHLWDSDDALSDDGGDALVDKVDQHGWTEVTWFQDSDDDDDDVEDCTLSNLWNCRNAGIIFISGHASPESMSVAKFETEAAADQYVSGHSTPWQLSVWASEETIWSLFGAEIKKTYYIVSASNSYFASKWKSDTEAYESIIILAGCHTNGGTLSRDVGGRVRFTYASLSSAADDIHNINELFGNMIGEDGYGIKRTAALAYSDGSFLAGFSWAGNGNTTVGPAPLLPPQAPYDSLSAPSPCAGKKGYGVFLFDTYMSDQLPVTDAVHKRPSSMPISNQRWLSNKMGVYGVAFDFDQTSGGSGAINLRAWGSGCRSHSSNANWRKKLCGDSKTYGADRDWTLP